MMRLPGQNLYDGRSLSAMLARMQDPNNGTHAGGLGSMLMKALQGYQMGKERREDEDARAVMKQAGEAMMGKPAVPDSPGPTMDGEAGYTIPGKAPNRGLAAKLLMGNERTAQMGYEMFSQDAARAAENEQFMQRFGMQNAAQDARFDKQLAASREDRAADREYRNQARADEHEFRREMLKLQRGMQREPMVTIMGPDGKGMYVPQSEAYGAEPYDPRNAHMSPPTAQDKAQISRALGVPMAQVDPLAGLPPRVAEAAGKEQAKQTEKALAEQRDAVSAGRGMMTDLKRFGQLQDVQPTGGIYGAPVIGGLARGVAGMFDPDVREMQSIADKITPSMRQPGSGATSDFDARMFQSATVGVDKPGQTNRNIIAAAQAKQQVDQDRLSFMESYATANGGSLRGADQAWQQYLDANPIFDPSSPNAPKLNPNRMRYQEFFGGGQKAPQAPIMRGSEDPLMAEMRRRGLM